MRLAIADPPYLGRAAMYYGDGTWIPGGNITADQHNDAHLWDNPSTHRDLLAQLGDQYDGFAVALAADIRSLDVYTRHAPRDARLLVWVKPDAAPTGSRISSRWEAVLVRVPPDRRSRTPQLTARSDVLTIPYQQSGGASTRRRFPGAKPPQWTRWILDVLGYDPDRDTVTDLFPGSGAVTRELAQGVLPLTGNAAPGSTYNPAELVSESYPGRRERQPNTTHDA